MIEDCLANATKKLKTRFSTIKKNKFFVTNNIKIGRSGSLSKEWEILVAESLKCCNNCERDLMYFVDYPVTLFDSKGKKIRKQPLYPDIMVVEGLNLDGLNYYLDSNGDLDESKLENKTPEDFNSNFNRIGKLVAIIDIKIDLGYIDIANYKHPSGRIIKQHNDLDKAEKWKFNYLVGAYNPLEKKLNDKVGKLCINVKDYKEIPKFSIVSTEKNDHGRISSYSTELKKLGYNMLYILDNKNHPAGPMSLSPGSIASHITDPKRCSKYPFVLKDNKKTIIKLQKELC